MVTRFPPTTRSTPARWVRAATPWPRRLAREADVILALGTRLGFNTTFYTYDNLNPEARIIHVDQDPPASDASFRSRSASRVDAGRRRRPARAELRLPPPRDRSHAWTARLPGRTGASCSPSATAAGAMRERPDPARHALSRPARDAAPPTRCSPWTRARCACRRPTRCPTANRRRSSRRSTSASWASPTRRASASSSPARERTVVSLMGDGGFGMTVSEIGTAVAHGINTVCIVMNNGCWGAEKAYQRDFFGGRYLGADVPNPPYDKLAELLRRGGLSRRPGRGPRGGGIRAALACGKPAIVDVQVDPDALYSFRRDSFKHRADKPK